jgi:hypothetical protein
VVDIQETAISCTVNNLIQAVLLGGRGCSALLHVFEGDIVGIEGFTALRRACGKKAGEVNIYKSENDKEQMWGDGC